MPGSDPMWYCHQCNAEMRPTTMSPQPLCASCGSDFVEQLPANPGPEDDPRALNAMAELFGNASTQGHFHDQDHDREPHPRGVGSAIDPIGQLLGAMLGMRNVAPETPPAGQGQGQGSPGSGRPTISIRRGGSEGSGRSSSGFQFSFRSGSGSGEGRSGGGGSGSGFGMFGGFGRGQERNERQEPANIDEFLATLFPGAQPGGNAQAGRPSPLLHNMLMGLFSAGIGNPGVGMGAHGDGRWGDYALNQEALDRIMTQLMEGNNPAPVPAPEDMIASWPRTILTPGNPLENEDCAVCKDSFAYIPPEADSTASSSKDEPVQPQEALTLPCKHSFHVDCIEPWVKVKGTCPVCRFELVSQDRRGGDNRNNEAPGAGSARSPGSGGGGGGLRPERRASGGGDGRGESPMPPGAYELD